MIKEPHRNEPLFANCFFSLLWNVESLSNLCKETTEKYTNKRTKMIEGSPEVKALQRNIFV